MYNSISEEPRALSLQEMEETNGGGVAESLSCDLWGVFLGAGASWAGGPWIGLGVSLYCVAMCLLYEQA